MCDKPDETIDSAPLVTCPFCGGRYSLGISTEGNGQSFHTLPLCSKFIVLDPLEFAVAARNEIERKTGVRF